MCLAVLVQCHVPRPLAAWLIWIRSCRFFVGFGCLVSFWAFVLGHFLSFQVHCATLVSILVTASTVYVVIAGHLFVCLGRGCLLVSVYS